MLNPDPLRAPGTDTDPPPRRTIAPSDDSHRYPDDEDSGLWAGVALLLTIALLALVLGIVIGRVTAG